MLLVEQILLSWFLPRATRGFNEDGDASPRVRKVFRGSKAAAYLRGVLLTCAHQTPPVDGQSWDNVTVAADGFGLFPSRSRAESFSIAAERIFPRPRARALSPDGCREKFNEDARRALIGTSGLSRSRALAHPRRLCAACVRKRRNFRGPPLTTHSLGNFRRVSYPARNLHAVTLRGLRLRDGEICIIISSRNIMDSVKRRSFSAVPSRPSSLPPPPRRRRRAFSRSFVPPAISQL